MSQPDNRTHPGRCSIRLAARVLLVALAGVASVGGLPGAAHAQDAPATVGIRLAESPTDRADDPRAQQYIVDHLAPGTRIERRIEVANSTPTAQEIELYPAAATLEAGGGFVFGADRAENDLTTWTTVDRPTVDLAPGATGEATVTIAVPADASAGERYAVIWAQPPSGGDPNGVQSVNRVGIRVYLSVGEGGEPASDFTIDGVEATRDAEGIPSITAAVHNTGGRALDLAGTLTLADGPGGTSAGPFATTKGSTLAIGATGPVAIALDPTTPDGPWSVTIELRSGTTTREVTATVTFPTAGGPRQEAEVVESDDDGGDDDAGDDGPGWVLPVAGATVVLLLAGAGAAVLVRRRP